MEIEMVNLGPVLSGEDSGDVALRDAELSADGFLSFAVGASASNLVNLAFCQLGQWMRRALVPFSVPVSVFSVLRKRSPFEVLKPVIVRLAVKVAALVTRRAIANESREHETMNPGRDRLSVDSENQVNVPAFLAFPSLEHSGGAVLGRPNKAVFCGKVVGESGYFFHGYRLSVDQTGGNP